MGLTEQQIERYSRNIRLDKVGDIGQEKQVSSKELITGQYFSVKVRRNK